MSRGLTAAVALTALLAAAAIPMGAAHAQGQGSGGNASAGAGGGNPDAGNRPTTSSAGDDGRGPQANRPGETGGGKPVWAQEGIPAVELGRLSVVRSPDHVLEAAYTEALATLTDDMVDFYNLSFGDLIAELSLNFDSLSFIDSPLQNLALLDDALDGTSALADAGVGTSARQLSAIFLGVASDKTLPISEDTVIAVTTILGHALTDAEISALADDAEDVRIAVLAGHG
ncbi:hypothetical protein HMH01_06255 [Halovulum dunhuangense]|uniref:Uncharacterized protein n=1 Tax=Halovulum dunhuangense TaxID=1505036 RepID=A0A849L168_9RHOB|nr:hypothetical protein [Halovulum dunhuangense]NNU80038.1 hypothetical protein [Halovulum dunhuangense]